MNPETHGERDTLSGFVYRLPQNLARIFWGKNLFWHLLAIVVTVITVLSGFDWQYFKATRHSFIWGWALPAIVMGFALPLLIPLAIIFLAFIKQKRHLFNTAFALGQAAAVGWFVSAFYKAFTGRPGPEILGGASAQDITHIFRFGFLRGGTFWGWPSSHTTVAFAMSLTLFELYPENKVVRIFSLLYALYVGVSVSMTIHFFSDFVAGAIFGSVVGVTIGQSFLRRGQNHHAFFKPSFHD